MKQNEMSKSRQNCVQEFKRKVIPQTNRENIWNIQLPVERTERPLEAMKLDSHLILYTDKLQEDQSLKANLRP